MLAAQLTRDLAPMISSHAQAQREQEEQHHLQQAQQAVEQVREADMHSHGQTHEDSTYKATYAEQPQEDDYRDHSQQQVEFHHQAQVQEENFQHQSQGGETEYHDQSHGTHYEGQPEADMGLDPQLHPQLQAHDLPRELQHALHEQAEAQAQAQAHAHTHAQSHGQVQCQHVEPQSDLQSQSQTPDPSQYAPPPPLPAHLSHGMPLTDLAQQYQLVQNMQDNSGIAPRKRSKVSRACDECRRKKIKCDALSENVEEACSNCRRSNAQCLFSRVPQKRGPSKGYIKELADRINSIEGKLGGSAADLLDSARRVSAEAFATPIPLDDSRKRPFASISTEGFSTPPAPRQVGWPTEHRPIQPYQPIASRAVSYNANGLAPQPIGPKPDSIRQESQVADSSQLDSVMGELSESTWRLYKSSIHQTFPILASDRFRAQALIAQCPVHLREAFLEAFEAALKHTQGSMTETGGDARTANRLLTEWETEGNRRSLQTDLVHLQTLILMAIETDSHGPSSIKGHHGGPAKGSFIGRAISLAYSMGLHMAKIAPLLGEQLDLDTENKVAMRAWWSLVMLDRWHAVGAALPAQIPNDTAVILPGLKYLMGEGPFNLLYLSSILGNFVPMVLSQPKNLGPSEERTISSWVNFAVDSFRLNFPPHLTPTTYPVPHLAYWHCRLLAYLFTPSALSTDALWAARESLHVLTQHPLLRTPLNHHFSSLTAGVLLELAKVDRTRDEALKVLRDMVATPFSPSAWDNAIRAKISDKLRPVTGSGGIDSQNLQHLADLATATTELAAAIAPAGTGPTTTITVTDNRPAGDQQTPQHQEQQQDEALQDEQQQQQQAMEHQPPPILFRVKENYEDLGFDPRPMLQVGYLNAFSSSSENTV